MLNKCLMALLAPLQIFAGGVILYEISSTDTRYASAGWAARASDPSTVFTNPAGMTRFCETEVQYGGQGIYGHVKFEPNHRTVISGDKGRADIWLPSGSFFLVKPLNHKVSVGLGALGYFGSDLVYNHDWVGRYYVQKVMCEGLSAVPSVSYKISEKFSIGIGANIMYGFMKQRSAVRNILDGTPDGWLNFHDNRFGFGGLCGILYQATCSTRFGIQYVSPVKLNFRPTPKFHRVGPILNSVLTATGVIGSRIKLNVKVPQSVMISAYHDFNPTWTIMANAGWQEWSAFQKVSVALADVNSNQLTFANSYLDTWHVALGGEFHYTECFSYSAGIAYDTSAIKSRNRPLDFPIGEQFRIGTGFHWDATDHFSFDFSTTLQIQGDLKADVTRGETAGRVAGVFRNTYALFLNANLSYSF